MGDLRLTPRGLLAGGRLLPCSRGRGGITGAKREGDGCTPRGAHRVEAILFRPDRLARPHPAARPIHPRDLSEGQRLTLALAIVLAAEPPLILLDEPTRGLDYTAKHRLVEILRDLAAEGHAVMLATHDVELVAEVANRVVVLADGEVVADGSVPALCHTITYEGS